MRAVDPLPMSSPAGRLFSEIRNKLPRPALTIGQPLRVPDLDKLLELPDPDFLGTAVADPKMAAAVRAGLLLWADRFEASHAVSQDLETAEGSYWHAILHRREPDFSNSKYWFRRVGAHPVFAGLLELGGKAAGSQRSVWSQVIRGGTWDPFHFVDLCEACERGAKAALRGDLEEIQAGEMELLLEHCYRRASGG